MDDAKDLESRLKEMISNTELVGNKIRDSLVPQTVPNFVAH